MTEIEKYCHHTIKFECPNCGGTGLMERYTAEINFPVIAHDGMDAEVGNIDLDTLNIGESRGFICRDCDIPIHSFNDWTIACLDSGRDPDRPEPIFHWLKRRGMLEQE